MLFYFKKNKNPNSSPRLQLTSLNKELYSLRNNSIDFAEKWRNSFIKFTSKIQTTGSSASFWAENENDKVLYESLNEISIYLTDFETQSKSWLSCQKNWIELLKELSENETNYIDKEKEYFKILSKLHDITTQIRNYDQESQDNNNKDREKNKEGEQGERNNLNKEEQLPKQESKKMKSSLLSLGRKEKKKVLSHERNKTDHNKEEKKKEGKLKIPSTLYKLIQESSKMWNQYMKTYSKLEESLCKLKIMKIWRTRPESKKKFH
ncbi:hypothetical protein LY90DRAFT_498491 [Neocallimastix californiae]|uniref:Uncharacterized protein n=1 Tax=Neocallimastix californiae TaxID=1754190 RepID=A0A1Y2FVA5_9FUNG|nr:hypothetical protein LY90DRAFT_498491 [Neocallimastix californiae]|eukprot:ORY87234.1 hypothetical protein LY90DRAFT_498491 [Neocallimastix californiae]